MNIVTLHTLNDFVSKNLNNERDIQVLLPPNYSAHKRKKYRVLYLNDGQDLRALRVKATLQRLYEARALEPVLVVAIPANADRLNEYGTARTLDYKGRGARALAYQRFVIEEVMPEINGLYRAHTGPDYTAVLGASLGGLAAFDMAWHNPHLFGTCGVFSGSFWWRTQSANLGAKTISRIAHNLVRACPHPPRLRFWFQAGTEDEKDDRDNNGVIDAIQDTTELMDELALRGYQREVDMTYLQVEGGQHTPSTWAGVLDRFLLFAFGKTPTDHGKAG
jgi:enterochelin esterase-like enzyme